MWGVTYWGGLLWGGLPQLNMPHHGRSSIGGIGAVGGRNYVQMLIMQEAQRRLEDNFQGQLRFQIIHGAVANRMRLVQQMEAKIAERDADDLFISLAV